MTSAELRTEQPVTAAQLVARVAFGFAFVSACTAIGLILTHVPYYNQQGWTLPCELLEGIAILILAVFSMVTSHRPLLTTTYEAKMPPVAAAWLALLSSLCAIMAPAGGIVFNAGPLSLSLSSSITGSLTIILLAATVLLRTSQARKAPYIAAATATTSFVLSYLAVASHIFPIPGATGLAAMFQASFPTAIALCALSAAAVLELSTVGIGEVLASSGTGGMVARRLLPAALGLPLLVGWSRTTGQNMGLYGPEFGVIVLFTFMTFLLAWLTIWISAWINKIENRYTALHQALQNSERKHRLILEQTDEGFITTNTDGVVLEWNAQAERMFGWSRSETIGKPLSNLIIPEAMRSFHDDGMKRFTTTSEGKPFSRQLSVEAVHKDGHSFPVEMSVTPIKLGDETIFCAFLRDISQRRDYERKLSRARDQAIKATKEKSRFLANMSHEIRTPLNAVIGLSDLLERTKLSDEQRELIKTIKSSGTVLLDLINNILDYSKIAAGKLELEFVEFEFVPVVEETGEMLASKARAKQLSLMTYVDPAIPIVLRGDAGRVRQVLINLIDNAIKFTEAGEITVRAIEKQRSNEKITVRFEVNDTGIGISNVKLDSLFKPFTQAEASITRNYGGSGLGLSISKKLVSMMGGTMGVHSVFGNGSTFWFEVQLEMTKQGWRTRRLDIDDTSVLIIDGPPGSSGIMHDYFNSWGLKTEKAVTFSHGLELADEEQFDIVMVDAEPPIDDWCKLIKNVNRTALRDAKFVLLSPTSDETVGEKALASGYHAYLTKPIKQSRLFDCVASLVYGTEFDSQIEPSKAAENVAKITSTKPSDSRLVLVVEDNPVNQKVALLQLRDLGLAAHAVGNGKEALVATATTNYALILMDCEMPEMDGYEATGEIRKAESLTGKRTPIVAMTAHAMPGDKEKCIAAGMDDYISKPVNQAKLNDITSRWLNKENKENPVQTAKVNDLSSLKDSIAFLDAENDFEEPPVELELLEKTFGTEATNDILKSFLLHMDRILSLIDEGIAREDRVTVCDLFHQIKGMSSSVYASELSRSAWELEKETKEEPVSWSHVKEGLAKLQRLNIEAKTYIKSAAKV